MRYEYQSIFLPQANAFGKTANSAAGDGWECFSVVAASTNSFTGAAQQPVWVFLRRPVVEQPHGLNTGV